jgi:hypothetical protein
MAIGWEAGGMWAATRYGGFCRGSHGQRPPKQKARLAADHSDVATLYWAVPGPRPRREAITGGWSGERGHVCPTPGWLRALGTFSAAREKQKAVTGARGTLLDAIGEWVRITAPKPHSAGALLIGKSTR